jgi:hypothetical protein
MRAVRSRAGAERNCWNYAENLVPNWRPQIKPRHIMIKLNIVAKKSRREKKRIRSCSVYFNGWWVYVETLSAYI